MLSIWVERSNCLRPPQRRASPAATLRISEQIGNHTKTSFWRDSEHKTAVVSAGRRHDQNTDRNRLYGFLLLPGDMVARKAIHSRRCPVKGEDAQDAHTLSQGVLGIFGVSAIRQAASSGVSESELRSEQETDSSQSQPPLKSDFREVTFSRSLAVRSCFSDKPIDLAAT